MINLKIIFIVFGVIACVSVASLIIYDQYESNSDVLDMDLQKVLDYCEAKKAGEYQINIGYEFHNGTHYIDNNSCEWKEIQYEIIDYTIFHDDYPEYFTDDFEIDYTEEFD